MSKSYLSHRPVLAAADVALLKSLNRDYLDLLVFSFGETGGPLGTEVMRDLRQADAIERDAMAACSYSLFALEFPERAVEDAAGTPQVNDPVALRYSTRGGDNGTWPAFVTTAWFFAWLLSRNSPRSVRFMLGLQPAKIALLAGLAPWQLRHLAALQPLPLPPRWQTNPCFWPDLIRFARNRQPLRLTAAHLLGVQLLAAEAAPPHPTGLGAEHARLRGP